jgi:hypothetical protein
MQSLICIIRKEILGFSKKKFKAIMTHFKPDIKTKINKTQQSFICDDKYKVS